MDHVSGGLQIELTTVVCLVFVRVTDRTHHCCMSGVCEGYR